ncbi:MAG: hypothetical protein JWM40_1283 [Frankiales bacterium]|nr:hypothetical protein [Frankiales bacterium]
MSRHPADPCQFPRLPIMKKPVIALVVVLGLLAAGGIGWALFEHHERSGIKKTAAKACAGLDVPPAGAPTELPLGLPLTTGETVLSVTTQGKTTIAFAALPGTRDDVVKVRDQLLTDLRAAGYTAPGTDQEPGFEAEAELAGTHEGTLKVAPLCENVLSVRYKINQ